jgi:tripartite-type tricarboxylate transporter receptor subunit TctC
LGQQLVVENVAGGGGMTGTNRVAKAAPDGYQVAFGSVDAFAQALSIQKNVPYDPVADFAPVALAVEQPLVLVVRKEMPVSNLREFVTYVKANHQKMQFGSAGVGGAPHLACSQLLNAMGVSVTHVPYRSSAAGMQDIIAGHIDFYCPIVVGAKPLIESEKLKALAILTAERSPLVPNLPTAKEQGVDVVDGYYWMGYFLPKGTPEPIVNKLNEAINVALGTPSVQENLRNVVTTPVARERRTPAYLKEFIPAEIKKWAEVVKASGITPQ